MKFAVDCMHGLCIHLCADEVVIVTVDSRTGRLNLRDVGDLATAGRSIRYAAISDRVNDNPSILFEALVKLRLQVSLLFVVAFLISQHALVDNYRYGSTKYQLSRSSEFPHSQLFEGG